MARFLSRRLERNGRIYHIELGVDKIAGLRHNLSLEIAARTFSHEDGRAEAVNAVLTLDLERKQIVIEVEGEELGSIPLSAHELALVDEQDVEGAQDGVHDAWDALLDHLVGDDGTIEQIIEGIPAVDPLLGCLLKGAISASVGQIIRCYRGLPPEDEAIRQKLRSIARCLGRNIWGILGRATYRSVRCMARAGV